MNIEYIQQTVTVDFLLDFSVGLVIFVVTT